MSVLCRECVGGWWTHFVATGFMSLCVLAAIDGGGWCLREGTRPTHGEDQGRQAAMASIHNETKHIWMWSVGGVVACGHAALWDGTWQAYAGIVSLAEIEPAALISKWVCFCLGLHRVRNALLNTYSPN